MAYIWQVCNAVHDMEVCLKNTAKIELCQELSEGFNLNQDILSQSCLLFYSNYSLSLRRKAPLIVSERPEA